jgi:hypothetical protein
MVLAAKVTYFVSFILTCVEMSSSDFLAISFGQQSADGKQVELISPPSNAPAGERVFIHGLHGEPFSSTQVKKKKTWEAVAKELKTGEGGIAMWGGKEIRTSAGACSAASLVGAPIS